MADETNTTTPAPAATGEAQTPAPAATPAKAAKPKTVLDDMPSRVIKDTHAEAIAYITNAAGTYSDFADYEIISPIDAARKDAEGNPAPASGLGQDEEGNLVFDAELFPDSMRVMIAVLTVRGDGPNSSRVKAIVVSPVPTVDDILADPQGKLWIEKIVGTELNRIAVRNLRPDDANISDVTVLDSLPKSLADYVTSQRGGASTLLEAFEDLWKNVKAGLSKLSKAWKLANLSKREFKNAMSSAAYASQYYPTLEETPKGSLFEFALQAFILEAKKAGKDASIFEQWLANRAEHVISADEAQDEEDISLDALTAAMAAPSTESTTETETPSTDAEQPGDQTEQPTEESEQPTT